MTMTKVVRPMIGSGCHGKRDPRQIWLPMWSCTKDFKKLT